MKLNLKALNGGKSMIWHNTFDDNEVNFTPTPPSPTPLFFVYKNKLVVRLKYEENFSTCAKSAQGNFHIYTIHVLIHVS